MITVDDLVKDPGKITRLGKSHPEPCKGGCGRMVWADYCRKCQKARVRSFRKRQARLNKERGQ